MVDRIHARLSASCSSAVALLAGLIARSCSTRRRPSGAGSRASLRGRRRRRHRSAQSAAHRSARPSRRKRVSRVRAEVAEGDGAAPAPVARAGYHSARRAVFFAAAEIVCPIVLALRAVRLMGVLAAGSSPLLAAGRRLHDARASGWSGRSRSGRRRSRTAFPTRSTCSSSASKRARRSIRPS